MKKIIVASLVLVTLILAFVGCAAVDVVQSYSPGSMNDILKAVPSLVKDNTAADHYYYLTVDNETVLKVSHDYGMTGKEDIVLQTPLKPFADAGLDVSKLGAGYKTDAQSFYIVADYGDGTGKKDNFTDAVFDAVKFDRTILTYHQALDHYGIKLPGGKFEYAKDYKTNDKDIVFVIKAKPLADLGVDVHNISGWTFKTMQEADGSNVDVLLKPYDLK